MAFYVSSLQTPTKNLKRPQRLSNDKSQVSCSDVFSSQRHLGGATSLPLGDDSSAAILPKTGHGLKQGCLSYKFGSKITRVQARKLERQTVSVLRWINFCLFFKKCLISQKGNTKGFAILSRPTLNCLKASGRRKWNLN